MQRITVNIPDADRERIEKLARVNHRTLSSECLTAIEAHIERNRELLKAGKKLPTR